MAGKLTIKRNGGCLPTLSLLAVLLLGGAFAWLTLAGLPDFVLRDIEQRAADAGVPVKIGALKLSPGSGLALKVQDISLSVPQQDAPDATLDARKIQVRFALTDLLRGRFIPSSLYMRDAEMSIPLSADPEKRIASDDIDVQGTYTATEGRLEIQFHSLLQGMDLNLRANLPQAMLEGGGKTEQAAEEAAVDLSQLLADARPHLERAYNEIAAQHWESRPTLRVALDFMEPESPRAFVQATLPSYELDAYHFRQVVVDANYHENVVIVNSLHFQTTNPVTEVDFMGGYDLEHRRLDFDLSSNAPLLYILRSYLGEDAPPALKAFRRAEDATPRIELEGQADFTEEFALNHISVRGTLEQKGCAFNDSIVNRSFLSFFLADGNFNINELSLEFPDGKLQLAAQSSNGKGHAEADVSMPTESLLKLAGNLSGEPVSLPEGISAEGLFHVALKADMSVAPFIPGKTQLQELAPTFHAVSLLVEPEHLKYSGTALTRPSLSLAIDGTDYFCGQDALNADSIRLSFTAEQVVQDTPDSSLTVNHPKLSTELKGVSANLVEPHNSKAEQASVRVDADEAISPHATLDGLSLQINAAHPGMEWKKMLEDGSAKLEIASLKTPDDFQATGFTLNLGTEDERHAAGTLSFNADGRDFSSSLQVEMESEKAVFVQLNDTDLPLAALSPLLDISDEQLKEIRVPHMVELSGCGHYDFGMGRLSGGRVHVHIPELVRTPYTVPAFRSMEIPVELTLDADLSTNDTGDICYSGHALVSHKTGNMDLQLTGNLSSGVHITGRSDMLVSTIDSLIDDVDAHSIMRDFRFRSDSKTLVEDIDTHVDYSNGIRVVSRCNARLSDLDYMQGGVVEGKDDRGRPDGHERVRDDLPDKDPLTAISQASCTVDVDLQLDAKAEDGSALPDRQMVTLTGISLEYDNKPWLQRRGIQGGTAKSTFKCKSILFNLDNNFMVLEDGSGKVYPGYAFGTFYAPLETFMKDINLPDPAQVEAKRCVFPIAKNTKEPMVATIRVQADKPCTYHFLGTDIPLSDFSGFIHITDDFVHLDRMNAKCWGGIIKVSTKLGITGESTSIDGMAEVKCMDLKKIAASYGAELKPALCNGNVRFQSPSPELQPLQAYGEVDITNGDLMQLGIFSPISELISDIPGHLYRLQDSITGRDPNVKPGFVRRSISYVFNAPGKLFGKVGRTTDRVPLLNHFFTYDIQDAYARFIIKNGHLSTRYMKAKGTNLNVGLNLDVNLDNMAIAGDLWPKITSVPSVVIAPIAFLSKFVIDIKIYGSVSDLKWKFGLADKKPPVAADSDVKPDTSVSADPQKEDELPQSKRRQRS